MEILPALTSGAVNPGNLLVEFLLHGKRKYEQTDRRKQFLLAWPSVPVDY